MDSVVILLIFTSVLKDNIKVSANNIVPILQEYSSNMSTQIGSTLKIDCPISVNSKQDVGFYISWTVNDVDENMLSMDLRYEFQDNNKVLQVKNIRLEDAGIYKCKGVTGYGVREALFFIKVLDAKYCHIPMKSISKTKYKPCFLNSLMQNEISYHKVVKDVGSSVEFDCFAAGHPSPEYLWMKGKSSADWIDNVTSIRQPMLRINNIKLEYAGQYTCKVYNALGEISYTYTLIVREKHSIVPRIIDNLTNVTAKLETQAVFVGTVSCNCRPIIQWFKKVTNLSKNSKAVQLPNAEDSERNEYYIIVETDSTDSRLTVETVVKDNGFLVSILRFKSVIQEDAGKYILFTTRGNYGMSYKTVYLDIQGPSDANKKNHPRLIIYIAIPIFILILCFGVIFYCWSRNHRVPRAECSKTFCVGSSSASSSTNMKSFRSHYPPSTGTGSAATGKYSNGSSFTTAKKNSSGTTDNTLPQSLGGIPLLPQQGSSRSFSPVTSGNVLIQEPLIFDPSINSSGTSHFNQPVDSTHFSYSKIPSQQIVFPHSNSRVSNSSHPNTNSSSSNCSDHTNMSFSNPLQPNVKISKSQTIPSSNIQVCSPTVAFNATSSHPTNTPISPYFIQQTFEPNLINHSTNALSYPLYSDVTPLANNNQHCGPDFFPGHNSSSPSNTYSFT